MKINASIFREYDIRGQYPRELNEQTAWEIARALVAYTKAKKIVVGRDRRPQSAKIFPSFISGLQSAGARVESLGVCATPALFFAVGAKNYEAGAMITASHSPQGQTGIKFCDREGRALGLGSGLEKIKKLALKNKEIKKLGNRKTPVIAVDILADYKKFIFSLLDKKAIKGFKVVLDASSGSAATLAENIFDDLSLNLVKMNFEANDKYPDHDLNPLLEANQRSIKKEVVRQQARLGILWDGDGDRVIFIDERGRLVEPYYLNCLLAIIILEKWPGSTLIIDSRLNLALSQTIEKAGGKPLIHRSGYANIIKTMQAKQILFACENSGHIMFNFKLAGRRNYAFGDGIIPALLVLEYLKKNKLTLSQAVAPWPKEYFISGEINLPIKNYAATIKRVSREFVGNKKSRLDGLSVWGDDYFFNFRPSHTEPLARLNIEARNKKVLAALRTRLLEIIK